MKMIKHVSRRAALLGAPALLLPKRIRAQTITPATGLTSFVPLQSFGFSSSNTAAANSTAVTAALASGKPLFIIPESSPFLIASTIVLSGNKTLIGGNMYGVILQPPANTTAIQVYNQFNLVSNLSIVWPSQEAVGNTASIGIQAGSATNFLFKSEISNIYIQYANTPFANGAGGEFQNVYSNIEILYFSNWGMNFTNYTGGSSGSAFIDIRVENTAAGTPGTADCVGGVTFENYDNFSFNTLNIEKMCASDTTLKFPSQCSGIINSLHMEGVAPYNYAGSNYIYLNYECDMIINNFGLVFSNLSGGPSIITVNSGDCRVELNGFLEHDNTFASPYPQLINAYTAGTKVYVRDLNARNSGSIVMGARTCLCEVDDTIFDVAGGRVIAGLVGTAAPASGGMPAPFLTTAKVALPWVVGDRCNNTTPTATTTPGWRCTTGGSPGTWTAEPVL